MGLEISLRRLGSVVKELDKIAVERENDVKARQADLFGSGAKAQAPSILSQRPELSEMTQTIDRAISRIENVLQKRA